MEANFLTNLFFPFLAMVITFGLGLNLTLDDFKRLVIERKTVIIGLISQLALLPLVGFGLAYLFALTPELAVGLIIVAAAPGGTTANVANHLLKADTALSITLTSMSGLVAFITMPFWISLAQAKFMATAGPVVVPFSRLALPVALLTLIPVGAGLFVGWRWPDLAKRAKSPINVGSGVMLVIGIAALMIDLRENLVTLLVQAGPVTATLCFLTMLLGYVAASLFRLSQAARLAIVVETGLQNIPLALTVAASILGNPRFAIPAAAYGFVMIFLLALILGRVIVSRPMPWSQQL